MSIKCCVCSNVYDDSSYYTYTMPQWCDSKGITFNMCSEVCRERYIDMLHHKCGTCNRLLVEAPIKHEIPGGIRGCGTGRTLYFCKEECKSEYRRTQQCQACGCSYEYIMVDDKRVCSNTSAWMDYYQPTCLEKYTGNYSCSTCDKVKNVKDEPCYLVQINDGSDDASKYICKTCFDPFREKYKYFKYEKEDKWNKVYVHRCEFVNVVTKQFICDECHKKHFVEKLFIKDGKNVCEECNE